MVEYEGWAAHVNAKDAALWFSDLIFLINGISFFPIEPENDVSGISFSF